MTVFYDDYFDYSPRMVFIDVDSSNVATIRATICNNLWGAPIPPQTAEDAISVGTGPALTGASSCDEVTFTVGYGISANAYYFHPSAASNGKALVMHHGEIGVNPWTFDGMDAAVTWFLQRGYTVLFFSMPNYDPNQTSWNVTFDDASTGTINDHDDFVVFDNPVKSSIKGMRFFIEPAIRGVKFLMNEGFVNAVYVVGLSYGGTMAAIVPALDVRVVRGYPVAGLLPHEMWRYNELVSNSVHYESRRERFLYANNNGITGLSIMGAMGRKLLQTLIWDDTGGFNQVGRTRSVDWYINNVRARLDSVREFGFYYDRSQDSHTISLATREVIHADIMAS